MSEAIQVIDDPPRSVAEGQHDNPSARATLKVLRLGSSDCVRELRSHRDQWIQGLKSSDYAGLDLHPDLLLPPSDDPQPGVTVFANWPAIGAGGAQNVLLAVLAPKRVRLRVLPKPAVQVFFDGHRLVGNEVIGCSSSDQAIPFVRAMFDLLAERESQCILIESLSIGSPLHAAILAAAGERSVAIHWPSKPQPHWWIDFPPNPADYWKKFSSRSRYNIRAAARKLEHEFLRFTTSDDVPRFLELACQVSKVSWQARRLGALLSDTPQRRETFQRFAQIGMFRSYVLQRQDRPIAFMVGRQWNSKFTCETIGYDAEFSDYGPGSVLQFRVLEDLIARDTPRLYDFEFGDGDHKRLFGNRQSQSAAILLAPRTWKNLAIFGIHRRASSAVEWIRSSSAYKRLRRSYRQ